MTSRRPYWCPKTKKRRPCWCPKLVLWELNSFLMQTLSFVPINLHRYWPREWKHSIDIRSGFTSFKIKNLVNVENVVPEGLRTLVVYKFSCTSCNACFVGETSQHFSTRIRKHLFSYRSSNVFRHLQSSGAFRPSCTPDCFVILDSAATEFWVKLKESDQTRPQSAGETHKHDYC